MSSDSEPSFGRLRSLLWPIRRFELKTVLPMFFIYFLICINYSLLRAAKDALVITAPSSGAEVIPFIKLYAILPMALLFTVLYTRLANRFGREKVFYLIISIFLGFFTLFALILYPLRDALHPHAFCDTLAVKLPKGLNGLVSLFRNWTFTLFYVMSELWSTTVMTILFWGFANEVISVKSAKRYYAVLLMGANIASIFAGKLSILLSQGLFCNILPLWESDPWGNCIFFLSLIITGVGITIMLLFRWLNRNGLEKSQDSVARNKKPKIKMGLRENFAYLAKSKYLISIAIIVLTYNIAINLIEIIWKDQVKQLFPQPNDYNAYMGKVLMMMGAFSTFISIFFCGSVIRKQGWTFSAMISPIIILITGSIFFSFILFEKAGLGGLAVMLGSTPLALSVFFGTMQNCTARACKYTLFDATKEMAFIPLSSESKLKGKAAIDGVGSRLGKSGGSLIHQTLLIFLGTVAASAPYVAVILLLVIGAWIAATASLGKQFNSLADKEPAPEIEGAEKVPG